MLDTDSPHGENRECGDCQLCCEVLEVPDANTKAGEKCQHQCEKGCAIYQTRPQPCQDYQCLWLRRFFGKKDRPDKVGVFFSPAHHKDLGALLIAYERKAGAALNDERALGIINRFAMNMAVIVVPPDMSARRLVCYKPELLTKAEELLVRGSREVTML